MRTKHPAPAITAVEDRTRRRRSRGTARRTWAATAAVIPLVLAAGGCSMDFASMSPDLSAIRDGRPADQASGDEDSGKAEVGSDLAAGSTRHVRRTPEMSVVLDYWTEHVKDLQRGDPATVSLSVHVEPIGGHAGEVKITHIELVGDDGDLTVSDTGEFVVTPPFSYQTEFMTPSSTRTRRTVRAKVDLLVETEPRSGTFFRRSVIDTVRLTYAGE